VTDRKSHLDTLAVALMVFCCFAWGLNQVAAKAAMPEVPPLWQAALRSLGGTVLVAVWARARGIPIFARDGTLRGGLLAGALFGAEFVCIFIGLQFTTASRMVVFLYTSPFVVALGMPFISRAERLNATQIAGLLIAFAGVAWAFSEGFLISTGDPRQWLGDALGLAAAVIWGATTLVVRGTRLSGASAEKTLLYQLAVSGVLLAAAALWAGRPLPASLSALAWSSMLFQVVGVTAVSYLVWFWLIRRYPATRLASFTLLTPVLGLVLGATLLGEPVTLRLAVAVATVAAGIVLVNRRPA
jgi:drug/metabolite transporter (DMT)-like permease